MPFVLVVAGPNGSGKTTLTRHLRGRGIDFGTYINPDDIVVELGLDPRSEADSRKAQGEADRLRADCMSRGIDFSFETVMSHGSKIDLLSEASRLGYEVTLFFVATEDPRINVLRVENRVAKGGHPVPEERILGRYDRSLQLLADAVIVAKRTVIFDNSAIPSLPAETGNSGLRVVAEVVRSASAITVQLARPSPRWVDRYLVARLQEMATRDTRLSLTIEHRSAPF